MINIINTTNMNFRKFSFVYYHTILNIFYFKKITSLLLEAGDFWLSYTVTNPTCFLAFARVFQAIMDAFSEWVRMICLR